MTVEKNKFRLMLTSAFLASSLFAAADVVKIGDIWFDFPSGASGCLVAAPPSGEAPYSGDIVVPATVTRDGTEYAVTAVAECAFQNCTELKTLALPESLDVIPGYMCAGCTSLTEVRIPGVHSEIGEYAFVGCSSLTSYSGASCVILQFGTGCFKDCVSLLKAEQPIPAGRIGHSAFSGCRTLTAARLFQNDGDGTMATESCGIDPYAFSGCRALTEVEFSGVIPELGEGAFRDCSSLRSVEAPEEMSVEVIPDHTFGNCASLEVMGLSGIEKVGDYAFAGCSSLRTFEVETLREAGEHAFAGCSSLHIFMVPENMTRIERSTFSNCTGLISFYTGKNMEWIGESAFEYCTSLKRVSFTQTLRDISYHAFHGCDALEAVYSESDLPAFLNAESFDRNVYRDAVLYVPVGEAAHYGQSSNWSNFMSIQETRHFPGFEGTGIEDVMDLNASAVAERRGGMVILKGDGGDVRIVSTDGIAIYDGRRMDGLGISVPAGPVIVVTENGAVKL